MNALNRAKPLQDRTEMMGAYKPSTLRDFEMGKPLEIEAIWGEPLRRAVAAGAKVRRLELLYSQLKHIDLARQSARAAGDSSHNRKRLTALSGQA